jgi:hypothetical protein
MYVVAIVITLAIAANHKTIIGLGNEEVDGINQIIPKKENRGRNLRKPTPI